MNVFEQLLQLIRLDSIGLTWLQIRLPSANTFFANSKCTLFMGEYVMGGGGVNEICDWIKFPWSFSSAEALEIIDSLLFSEELKSSSSLSLVSSEECIFSSSLPLISADTKESPSTISLE